MLMVDVCLSDDARTVAPCGQCSQRACDVFLAHTQHAVGLNVLDGCLGERDCDPRSGPFSTLVGHACRMDHFRAICGLVLVRLARLIRERAGRTIWRGVIPMSVCLGLCQVSAPANCTGRGPVCLRNVPAHAVHSASCAGQTVGK